MLRLKARSLLAYSTDQLWEMLTGEFILIFDDGEIVTDYKETLYSAYGWMFHQLYPVTPLLKKHHVQSVIGAGVITSKTHLVLLGNVMWSVHAAYHYENDIKSRDYLAKLVYETTNRMYNDLSRRLEEYVVSLDILDFLEIHEHPDVKPVLDSLTPDQASIDYAYSSILSLLKDKTKLPHNSLCRATQAGLTNENQVLQCLGPRGYLTDIDSVIFPVPVMRGYFQGIRLFHDSLVESRSTAKSLYFSKDPLQAAEYFARRLQILCQVVKNLHFGDCGSTEYLLWKIKEPTVVNGVVTSEGDLKNLVGKFYLDEETNTLKTIKYNDFHLEGKSVRFRSVVSGCAHPDPYGVCSTCFGDLAYSIPENSNLGHACSVAMTEQSSQSVLSVKHFDGSSVVDAISLTGAAKKFFSTTTNQAEYIVNKLDNVDGYYFIINPDEAKGLTDIKIVKNVNELTITRVSEIEIIGFMTNIKGAVNTTPINVSLNNRKASLTHHFLDFARRVGWTIDDKGNFIFDLATWDFKKPILVLPQKHFNMGDHSNSIASMIESRVNEMTDRPDAHTPSDTLVEFFELVNSKLKVNLAVLEVIIYAAMVVNPSKRDFRLPKPWTEKTLGVASLTIPNRSLGAVMAYKDHRRVIVNPTSFFKENRPSHVMDVFLCPREVVEDLDYRRK